MMIQHLTTAQAELDEAFEWYEMQYPATFYGELHGTISSFAIS